MDLRNPAALTAFIKGDIENAMAAGTPGGIEAQEAAGQRALVANFRRLPKEYGHRQEFPRTELEALGFVIGDEVDGLFLSITPPAGWSLKPTEHSMWSDVLDDRGRKRASVFYKAAFYDRRAHFHMTPRYAIVSDYKDAADGKPWQDNERRAYVVDNSTGQVLFDAGWIKNGDHKGNDKADASCLEFVRSEFPQHANPFAYW